MHGDFDVDGVCATTILVGTLRELGAECDWLIPDRIADGYGLSAENVERLAERGTQLLITVDCGITAVDGGGAGALARHGRRSSPTTTSRDRSCPTARSCTRRSTAIRSRSFAGPRWRGSWRRSAASRASRERAGASEDRSSTWSPWPPSPMWCRWSGRTGRWCGAGWRRCAGRSGPGFGRCWRRRNASRRSSTRGIWRFGLAPRINAAGRLYRADAGVELFLTEDEARAAEIAAELSRANGERRATEREVDAAAEAARRELPEELREAPALVLAGEGWHPGRDRDRRLAAGRAAPPARGRDLARRRGGGRGSGRSIPGFDLLAGLEACAEHLSGFGGHRAAAGLELRAENLDAFREAFAAHADVGARARGSAPDRADRRDGRRRRPRPRPGRGAASGWRRSGWAIPGCGCWSPRPGCATCGRWAKGKHARFSLHSGAHRALGVAFGRSSLGVGEDDPVDAAVRLEVNHWNGSVEPRVVLRELYPREPSAPARCPDRGVVAAVRAGAAPAARRRGRGAPAQREQRRPRDGPQQVLGRRRRSPSCVSSGAEVLAVCADASRRARPGRPGSLRRGGPAPVACERCGGIAVDALRRPALTDYAALASGAERRRRVRRTSSSSTRPPLPTRSALASRALDGWSGGEGHPGYLHLAWGEARAAFALAALEEQLARRPALIGVFRDLREAGEASGEDAAGGAPRQRPRTHAARRRPPAASASSPSSASFRARPTEATAPSGSYPQRGPIWSARRRSAPTAPATRRACDTSNDATSPRAARAPRRPLRRGRGVRLAPERRRQRRRPRGRHARPRGVDAPSTSPATATPTSCAAPATSSSPTRSGSPRSAPGCGSTPRRSARRCCTTRSRTPAPAWRRSGPSSARRSPSWSTASPS